MATIWDQYGNADTTDAQLITAANNLVIAIGELTRVMQSAFPTAGGVAGSATGGAATLPANPAGFITVTLPDGSAALMPYYNP